MKPPSEFSTRRIFLQSSAAVLAARATSFTSAFIKSDMFGEASASFAAYQEKRRKELWELLGDLPWQHQPGPARLLHTEEHEGYTLERLVLDLNGIEPVPALLLIPHKRQKPAGASLYPLARWDVRPRQGTTSEGRPGTARLCARVRRKGLSDPGDR